jgi:hypothetical protein
VSQIKRIPVSNFWVSKKNARNWKQNLAKTSNFAATASIFLLKYTLNDICYQKDKFAAPNIVLSI